MANERSGEMETEVRVRSLSDFPDGTLTGVVAGGHRLIVALTLRRVHRENLDWVTGFAGRHVPSWSRSVIGLGRKPRGLDTLSATVRDGDVFVTLA